MATQQFRLKRLNSVLKRGYRVEPYGRNFLCYEPLVVNGQRQSDQRRLIGQASNIDAAWKLMLDANGIHFGKLSPDDIQGGTFRT